jgi:hypothetical protein
MKHYVILTMHVIFLVGCQNSNKTQEKCVITSANMCVPVTTDRDWYYEAIKHPCLKVSEIYTLQYLPKTHWRALKSAPLFDQGLVPNAGHLVPMPSHVYIRTGDYRKGTLVLPDNIDI